MSRRLANLPIRFAAGAFILNSGVGKLDADEEHAGGLHGSAASVYPFFEQLEPAQFTRGLAVAELALGATLLAPFVPDRLAGLALTPFAAGLVGLYAGKPDMRREHSVRPSAAGTALAKDIWLLGIGLTLLASGRRGRS